MSIDEGDSGLIVSVGEPANIGATLTQFGVNEYDQGLRKDLGAFAVAAMTFSGMVGSGWLFAAYYSAQSAGPASIVSWVIGGIFTFLTAAVFIELSIGVPVSGGGVRWPQMSNGPFVGAVVGWVAFGGILIGASSEPAGIFQYASRWWPALFDATTGQLTWTGIAMCAVAMAFFTIVNFAMIRHVAFINNLISIGKWVIPFMSVGLLLASGFHSQNYGSAGGGFAPYGGGAILSVVTTGGIVYSFGGLNIVQAVAGEVRNPRRNVVLGVCVGIVSALFLYLMLEVTFLGVLPTHFLAKVGWHGLSFSSPFAQLAVLVNLGWLMEVLLIDAVASPSGAMLIGTTTLGRSVYGMAQIRVLPRFFRVVNRNGVPARALLFNLVFSIVSLIFLRSWHSITGLLGMFFGLGYAPASLALGVILTAGVGGWKRVVPGIKFICATNFVLSGLIMYWSGWSSTKWAMIFMAIFIPAYYFLHRADPNHHTVESLRLGIYFYIWIAFIGLFANLGARAYGGHDFIGQPWDSIIVGVVSLATYFLGLKFGLKWVGAHGFRGTPLPEEADMGSTEGRLATG